MSNTTFEFLNELPSRSFPNVYHQFSQNRPHAQTKSQRPVVPLVRWRLNFKWSTNGFIFPNFGLLIEGTRTDTGDDWTTSEVTGIDVPKTILTKNTTYELRGKIDRDYCLKKGFPMEFVKKFETGFPNTWKEDVNDFVHFLFNLAGCSNHAAPSPVVEHEDEQDFNSDSSFVATLPPSSPNRDQDLEDFEELEREILTNTSPIPKKARKSTVAKSKEQVPQKSTNIESSAKKVPRKEPEKLCTPSPVKKPDNLVNVTIRKAKTPRFENAAPTPVLPRSQRGRLLKPRLASGEKIIYNNHGSPVEVRCNVTRTHLHPTSSQNLYNISWNLQLETPKSPLQQERRLSNTKVKPPPPKMLSRSAMKNLLTYSDSEQESNDENDDLLPDPTPLPMRNRQTRRIVISDDEEEASSSDNEQENEEEPISKRKPNRKEEKKCKISRVIIKKPPRPKRSVSTMPKTPETNGAKKSMIPRKTPVAKSRGGVRTPSSAARR